MHACQGVTPLRRSLASEDFVKASLANAALRHIDAHLQPPEDDLDHSVEKQRGISVSSTVLQFDFRDFCLNLLDTPGHKDFSEDTYRVDRKSVV